MNSQLDMCPFCGRASADPAENRPGHARADGDDTMHEAAQLVMPSTGNQRGRALYCYNRNRQGLIDDELAAYARLGPSSVRARRIELVRSGHVMKTDEKRKTVRGYWAHVYSITPLGIAWVRENPPEGHHDRPV